MCSGCTCTQCPAYRHRPVSWNLPHFTSYIRDLRDHCASSYRGSDHIKSYDFRRLKAWLRPRWRHARCAGSRTTPTHTATGAPTVEPTARIKAAPHTPPTPACGGAVCIDWGSRECHWLVLCVPAAWHPNLSVDRRWKKAGRLHTCPGVPTPI